MPAAERMLNLIAGDVGRPLGQINPIVAADLEALAHDTIEKFAPKEIVREELLLTDGLMKEPGIVVDEALRIKTANKAFSDTFWFDHDRTVGSSLIHLKNDDWNLSSVHALAQQVRTVGEGPVLVSGRQFLIKDGKHRTVIALAVANG
jgi:PAS domain-containing protein